MNTLQIESFDTTCFQVRRPWPYGSTSKILPKSPPVTIRPNYCDTSNEEIVE